MPWSAGHTRLSRTLRSCVKSYQSVNIAVVSPPVPGPECPFGTGLHGVHCSSYGQAAVPTLQKSSDSGSPSADGFSRLRYATASSRVTGRNASQYAAYASKHSAMLQLNAGQ